MTSHPDFQKAQYLKSVVELEQLPADVGAEVAFIGRSNAGKSSALNTITGIKGLARVSKTPGRTQAINLFSLTSHVRLVDLPGYGYAKVPLNVKQRWERTVDEYLETRHCLRGLVLIMDIRHPLKELDQKMLEWAVNCELPIHILLTKADKLNTAQARKTQKEVEEAVAKYDGSITVQLFSSQELQGLKEARAVLTDWFEAVTVS